MKNKAIFFLFFCCAVFAIQAQDSLEAKETFSFDTNSEYEKGLAAISAFQYDQAAQHFYECQRNEPDNLDIRNTGNTQKKESNN